MKKIILFIIIYLISFSFIGCNRNSNIEKEVNKAEEIFYNKDIEQINNLIFGIEEITVDEEMLDFFNEQKSENIKKGILNYIFSDVVLKVDKIKKDNVEFKITAPNMEQVFNDLSEDSLNFTENDLLEYMKEYIKNTEKKEFFVSVSYVEDKDNNVIINYRKEEFINAITGGLLNAYKELYVNVLDEYR